MQGVWMGPCLAGWAVLNNAVAEPQARLLDLAELFSD